MCCGSELRSLHLDLDYGSDTAAEDNIDYDH